ncbi:hypothetical protein [Aequorivita antarctica]|uniref:DUF3575 domain-containing protein n=1 Tax=Aequorivita antarctica TaxID=153266 RepID=A0A5C6Z1D4_9FLAO|nr:hypothetical protein [Aequorivita antarctica]TXD73270.1 hypothetical protein ESU54_09025 [Aequorivita antarctica]SRX76023.1 hypothetical protein AEQU3_03021 [Aequorivita antarctica]
MFKKLAIALIINFLTLGVLIAKSDKKNDSISSYKYYVGSSTFMLGNLAITNSPAFYQLNLGYRINKKDVISIEAITWKYYLPLGIPLGKFYNTDEEEYPGYVKVFGVGAVYQHFLWKGLFTSIRVLPVKTKYTNEYNHKIQSGFQLFSTIRLGYQIPIFKKKFFIEPAIVGTFWPINTNVPEDFAEKDRKWNKFHLIEPGVHFGYNFN